MHQKTHYAALDALRGLAAVSILLFHLGQWQGQGWLAANSWLAVDFFFCLSGYVLSVAYGKKIDAGLSPLRFMTIRLTRLMPAIAIGTIISAAYLVVRIAFLHDPISVADLAIAFGLGMLCLPYFAASQPIGGPQVFPLNGPQYTLFLELVVNLVWVVLARRVAGLSVSSTIAIVCYVLVAIFGIGGDDVGTFWKGFPRVIGAYYAGVAVYQAQMRSLLPTGPRLAALFIPLLVLSAALFYFPVRAATPVIDLWAFVVPPLLVASGSQIELKGATRQVALVLGELSYPLYALHYPIFVWINAIYQQLLQRKDFVLGTVLVLPSALVGSWLILKLIDEPVRAWIARPDSRA